MEPKAVSKHNRNFVGGWWFLSVLFVSCLVVGVGQVDARNVRGWSRRDAEPAKLIASSNYHRVAHHELLEVKEYEQQQGFEATLRLVSHSHNETYGVDINPLRLIVRLEDSARLRVYISDYSSARYEIPDSIIHRPTADSKLHISGTSKSTSPALAVTYTKKPFGFAVTRTFNNEVLFNSTPPATTAADSLLFHPLVFKDQYLEISTQLPSSATLFGLGESTTSDGLALKKGRTYTLFTSDEAALFYNVELYGAYPFYMDVREDGLTHGVLLLNSNGMEVTYREESLTYKVLGGVLDFYFLPGPSPLDVVDQYTAVVGRPAAQPYWSFGFHQCRWGYRNVTITKEVVDNFKKAQIPLDTMWNDIDYMDSYKCFTHDKERFPLDTWRPFVDQLHNDGQHYVLITDPGISMAYNDYGTYLRGMKEDVFLKHQNDDIFMGQVWPGPVYFPDFLNPKTTEWWTHEIRRFHEKVPFDGMWIDMNEIANFCSGTCSWNGTIYPDNTNCYLQCTPAHSKYDDPPFMLNHTGTYQPLNYRTAPMTVKHHDGNIQYNTHSLFGISESKATHIAMTAVRKKRPFVLSRSTFLGSGQYTAHWTGDNAATWEDLAASLVTIMNAGLVGIPMVGADICGFAGATNEDLCNRWIQTGAFHPFSRAHNSLSDGPKELYLWPTVTASARKALGMKYRLLPYFYTLNFEAHKKGYPMVRPLFFAFPTDSNTVHVDAQFLIGNHVMVTPVLAPNATSVEGYFPRGTWYNMFDYSKKIVSKGENFTLDAPWDVINVHVHEGAIIPMQESALTSTEVRKTPFTLVVAFPADAAMLSTASGYVFLDDGDEIHMELKANKSSLVTFEAHMDNGSGMLKSHVTHGEYASQEKWVVDHLIILGVGSGNNASSVAVHVNKQLHLGSGVLQQGSKLHISGLGLPLGTPFELKWSAL